VHEESKRIGTRAGALIGLRATDSVITAAGLVLAGAFAVLVTALTLDVGRWMWWPSALFHKDAPDAEPEQVPWLAGAL